MSLRHILALSGIMFSAGAVAADCTMNPLPIDVKRIANNPLVKSYVVDKKKLALTALLKDGRFFKLSASGCDHSGGMVTLWLGSGAELSDTARWVKEAVALINMTLPADTATDIAKSLQAGTFETEHGADRTVLSGHPLDYFSYTVEVSGGAGELMLTVSYVIG